MNGISKKYLWAILCLFLFGVEIKAQYLDISGVGSYSIDGATITLSVERIDHHANPYFTRSGTLYLQLWTCYTPYNGLETSLGYKVAQATIDPLQAGYYYSDVVKTVPLYPPPDGTYYMVMVLAESDGTKPLTADWYNFPNKQTFQKIIPDTTIPTLYVTSPSVRFVTTRKNLLTLKGIATDNVSPASIEVRVRRPGSSYYGKWKAYSLPLTAQKTKRWQISLPLKVKGKWRVEMRARDTSGNSSRIPRIAITRK